MLNKFMVLNLTLLIAHQIDAAYWHEWDMFALPGGIQLFNFLNILIFLVALACFVAVIQRKASGFFCSLTIAAMSSLVLPIHTGFALAGYKQFDLPFSIFLIGCTFLTSIAQVVFTLKQRHEFGGA
jgi:hypothetical protein